MVKKFDFKQYLTGKLLALGAVTGGSNDLELDTRAGRLGITIYDEKYPWIACRFDDEAKAREIVRAGSLNRFSGKWNWHASEKEDMRAFSDMFLAHVSALVECRNADADTDADVPPASNI